LRTSTHIIALFHRGSRGTSLSGIAPSGPASGHAPDFDEWRLLLLYFIQKGYASGGLEG